MKEIFLIRQLNKLAPANEITEDYIKSLPHGEIFKAKISRPRNVDHHRKFFALLDIAFNNQERYKNPEHLRKVYTLKAGFYEVVETDKGDVYLPDSISFAKMDQDEFQDFYNKFLDVVVKELGSDKELIENEVKSFM
jgi:hypothetical protein